MSDYSGILLAGAIREAFRDLAASIDELAKAVRHSGSDNAAAMEHVVDAIDSLKYGNQEGGPR